MKLHETVLKKDEKGCNLMPLTSAIVGSRKGLTHLKKAKLI